MDPAAILARLTPAASAVIVALIALVGWGFYLDRSVIHMVVDAALAILGLLGTTAVHSLRKPRDPAADPAPETPRNDGAP